MPKITSLTGPVENIADRLVLRIPLAAGGSEFVACSRGVGTVKGDFLEVFIADAVANALGISASSMVTVDNKNGKFNIRPASSGGTA
jgi:hypothetical protein